MSDNPNLKLTSEDIELIEKMIPLYLQDKPACTHAYLNLGCSAQMCPVVLIRKSIPDFKCIGIPDRQIGRNLRKILDKLPKPKLDFTMPETLALGVREWLEASVKEEYCQVLPVGLTCNDICSVWINPKGQDWLNVCRDKGYLDMFKAILAYHKLPPLEYEVPLLTKEERKHVEYLTTSVDSPCDFKALSCSECHVLQQKLADNCGGHCFWRRNPNSPLAGPGSPERRRIIAALQAVLNKQDSLLPSHNVVQFAEPEREKWKWWLKQEDGSECCPSTQSSWATDADCDKQCISVFPEVRGEEYIVGDDQYTDCPCNRYSTEITRIVIKKCIALGVKEEPYPIWYTFTAGEDIAGGKRIITSEKDGILYAGDMPCICKSETNHYTTTPPKEKEPKFKPYVALTDSGRAVLIIKKTTRNFSEDQPGNIYHGENLRILTNPEEAYKMLGEQLGRKDMVEEAYEYMLRLINLLEGDSKCEK